MNQSVGFIIKARQYKSSNSHITYFRKVAVFGKNI